MPYFVCVRETVLKRNRSFKIHILSKLFENINLAEHTDTLCWKAQSSNDNIIRRSEFQESYGHLRSARTKVCSYQLDDPTLI